ncbi:MAG: phosphoadenylyl-sulfate reductase [Burkholderiaceae bacterium]|nr:phosphoadenylyl-sulfate reductase [Burkholderiaceae bacterium]
MTAKPPSSTAIGLYARATAGFEERVAATLQILREAAAAHPGRIVLATSLGAEDQVLTDLIVRHHLPIAVGTLETGALHPQTLALIGRTEAHCAKLSEGGLKIEVYRPQAEAVIQFVQRHGDKAMYESLALRKTCCGIRKLEPLARMLAHRSAWITGLRREQSDARGEVAVYGHDDQGRSKVNALVDWSWADVWHYIRSFDVPYNPLHDEFMPSIGCAPCTRAIAVGEPFRAGRWWWEDEKAKECGLHVSQAPGASAPAAEAPAVSALPLR